MIGRLDAELIAVALEHLDILHRHLERGELSDGIVVDAVSMRLSAAIEAVHGGNPALAQRLFGIEWQDIWAMLTASPTDT